MAATVAGASRTVASNTTLPAMVVFDLDACLWAPEMFQLPSLPTQEILAQGRCVGLRCAPRGPTVELFPGALHALRKLLTQPEWRGTRIAAASSSLEPAYSFACLRAIEVSRERRAAGSTWLTLWVHAATPCHATPRHATTRTAAPRLPCHALALALERQHFKRCCRAARCCRTTRRARCSSTLP